MVFIKFRKNIFVINHDWPAYLFILDIPVPQVYFKAG